MMGSQIETDTVSPRDDRVLAMDEAAVLAGVSTSTLKRLGHAGKLRILRLSPRRRGIRLSDLRAWLDRCAA